MTKRSTTSAAARTQERAMNPVSTLEVDDSDDAEQSNNSRSNDDSSRGGGGGRGGDGGPRASDSGGSSTTSHSGSGTTSSGSSSLWNKGARVEKFVLGQTESRYVFLLKLVVLGALVVAGLYMAKATHKFTLDQQKEEFEEEFADFSAPLITESMERFKNFQLAAHTAGVAITSQANAKGEVWPFVTVPHFETKAQNLLDQVGGESILMSVVVQEEEREEWESYSSQNQGWIKDGLLARGDVLEETNIIPYIHILMPNPDGPGLMRDPGLGGDDHYYVPVWQVSPPPVGQGIVYVNYNLHISDYFQKDYAIVQEKRHAVVSRALQLNEANPYPIIVLHQPIFEQTGDRGNVVAFIHATVRWDIFFRDRVPVGTEDIVLVLSNPCNQTYTYEIRGPDVVFVGEGDFHNEEYESLQVEEDFNIFDIDSGDKQESGFCPWTIQLYPTEEFRESYNSNQPQIFTAGVVVIFALVAICFIMYDCLVERKQVRDVTSAAKSNAIISSLFPAQVRDRLLEGGDDANAADMAQTQSQMNNGTSKSSNGISSRPIADLFPNCTVMFADVVGFTAWSSVREPVQVFILLESVYHAFDTIANQRRVFKVETIGDCYVAVTGLPDPRKNHAVAMARFANACLLKMKKVVGKLEVTLGPDTGELSMRIGLHSGPVTAGVLRGEKSRFQLFGDTVNTASRMESTGARGKIHISQDTADLLTADGKSHWIKPRDKTVQAKGKGELHTHWLELKSGSVHSDPASGAGDSDGEDDNQSENGGASPGDQDLLTRSEAPKLSLSKPLMLDIKTRKLVDWNVTMLKEQLKKMVAMRDQNAKKDPFVKTDTQVDGKTVIDEVQEIITLPNDVVALERDLKGCQLENKVVDQLRSFVTTIASMYHDVPFHCFEHASHVTMSVMKLLSRVVTPSNVDIARRGSIGAGESNLHEYTYGITSDPLTQFAVSFSALIHDVDHHGIPNAQLVKEKTETALKYKDQSVAEQNSVDIAWDLLMQPEYQDLRECICYTRAEQQRFRALVVNAVMATDIVDKELGALRKHRWEVAFREVSDDSEEDKSKIKDMNRKATIVIEHLIQASDVAHTMQHWHVYQKWNEKFFRECRAAFVAGRAEKDPALGWYQGELGFFDFYIIPLANKLKDCGCFGVSCDEYLNYALANRKEWERKGKAIVAGYIASYADGGEEEKESTVETA